MKIDEILLSALFKAVEAYGSQASFAKKAEVDQSLISRYIKKEVKSIDDENWEKLEPHLKKYMPSPKTEKHTASDNIREAIYNNPSLTAEEKEELIDHYNEIEKKRRLGKAGERVGGHKKLA